MKRICLVLTFVILTSEAVVAQKTFYNKEYKVGFKYPATVKLTKGENEPEENFKNLTGVSVIHPGRNIEGATATLAASKITLEACKELPQASDENKRRLKKFGANTFYRVTEMDGGMESVQEFEFYRTYHNGTCYEIRIQVGMAKNRPTTDLSAFSKLYTILRTMYFR